MKGSTVRRKIKEKGVRIGALAEALGTSQQNFYVIAIKNDNVTTGTLERIAEAIGEPVSYFYNELPIVSLEDYAAIRQTEKEVEMLRERVAHLQGIVDKLVAK